MYYTTLHSFSLRNNLKMFIQSFPSLLKSFVMCYLINLVQVYLTLSMDIFHSFPRRIFFMCSFSFSSFGSISQGYRINRSKNISSYLEVLSITLLGLPKNVNRVVEVTLFKRKWNRIFHFQEEKDRIGE